MGYRAILEANPETVQDLELSAPRRLEEAWELLKAKKYHAAIYIAGLSAEMYLKTACFVVEGAKPAYEIDTLLVALRPRKYRPPFQADFEAGHGLLFFAKELLYRRRRRGLRRAPNRFRRVIGNLHNDWFIGMRYRPGSAGMREAAQFIKRVEWLADNHAALRR